MSEQEKPEVKDVPNEEAAAQETPVEEAESLEVPVEEVEPSESEVSLEEAESKTGIKEDGMNQDAVDAAKEGDAPEEAALPSFFVEEEDRFTVEVDVLFRKEDGRLVSVSRTGFLDKGEFEALGFVEEKFHFKPVGYEQMSNYRQRCSVYRRDAGRALVDPVALRNYFIVWHLKDWTMRDRKGEKIGLSFNESGALDDDSIQQVYKINTTMLDVVLTLFEKDMMM